MTQYSYAQLEYIWEQAGGPAQWAPMAAAISMAESSGNSQAISPTADYGLWQINMTTWGPSMASLDVMTNARAAVKISNQGTNWRPWCTAWSDGACGSKGGSYEGSGSPYQKYLNGGVAPSATAVNATNAAANQQGGTQSGQGGGGCSFWDWIGVTDSTGYGPVGCVAEGWVKDFVRLLIGTVLNPVINWFAGMMGIGAGLLIFGSGIFVMIRQTGPGRSATGAAGGIASGAAMGAVLGPEGAVAGAAEGAATSTGAGRRVMAAQQRSQRTRAAVGAAQGLTQQRQASAQRSQAQAARAERQNQPWQRTTTRTRLPGGGWQTVTVSTPYALRDEADGYVSNGNGSRAGV